MVQLSLTSESTRLYLFLFLLTSGLATVSADTCNSNNCLRDMRRYSQQASPYCSTYLLRTRTTAISSTTVVYRTIISTITTTDATDTSVELSTDLSTSTTTSSSTHTNSFVTTSTFMSTFTTSSTQTSTTTTTLTYQNIPYSKRQARPPPYTPQCTVGEISSACSYLLSGAIPTTTKTVMTSTVTSTILVSSTQTSDATTTTLTTTITSETTTETSSTIIEVSITASTTTTTVSTVALASTTITCADCGPTQQVIADPSFEFATDSYWTTYAQVGVQIGEVVLGAAIDGDRVLQITRSGSTSNTYPHANLAQVLTFCGTGTYTFSFYIGVDGEVIGPTTGYVDSEYQVYLGGQLIVAKEAVCAGDASDCTLGDSRYHWRKKVITGLKPTACIQELEFQVYFKQMPSNKAAPPVLIDLVEMTLTSS